MMTKQELVSLFPAFSPKRAFQKFDDGWEVVGKWVRVAYLEAWHPLIADRQDTWDVFLCNTRDMPAGMGARRLKRLLATLPPGIRAKILDGEAWWQYRDVAVVRGWLEANRVALGIRKRQPTTNPSPKPLLSLHKSTVEGVSDEELTPPLLGAAPARVHEAKVPRGAE